MNDELMVFALKGAVFVGDREGVKRALKIGDIIGINETIVTEKGRAVDLQMANGRKIQIIAEHVVRLTQDLLDNTCSEADDNGIESVTVNAVIKAVNEDRYTSGVLEEAAAELGIVRSNYGN
jgi:hypothetical protein